MRVFWIGIKGNNAVETDLLLIIIKRRYEFNYYGLLIECSRCYMFRAPVAQLDRVLGFEPRCREFESLRAHHFLHRMG